MTPLFGFCHDNPTLTAFTGLDQYVQTLLASSAANGGINGQLVSGPTGQRTPGIGQLPIGASPHPAHIPPPGSPHVGGSPAAGAMQATGLQAPIMQAPGMHLSQSQQGNNNSSGPSANTSPAGTKRRRASGVKMEDDMNGGPTSAPAAPGNPQVNGLQGKSKPPTPRMQKKQKVNAS